MNADLFNLTVHHTKGERRRLLPTHCTVDGQPGRMRLASCGRQVLAIEIDEQAPTCPECAAARAADLADTRTGDDVFGGPSDPALAVKADNFDPTADYTPRWRF